MAASVFRYKTICNERPVCGFCTRSEAVLCGIYEPLTLSLLVLGIFGTNNHNFAVALDNLALVAHGLN